MGPAKTDADTAGHQRLADLSVPLQAADDANRSMSMTSSLHDHLVTSAAFAVATCITGEIPINFLS